jgi:O-antigen/teichoic acid export membrane protein
VIANTIYSFVLGFSSLGLGHWFIREIVNNGNKQSQIDKFFKMQLLIGVVFYAINIIISFVLYKSVLIRELSLIIGINIIFDNIIYVIKSLNIAESKQRKTFILLIVEAFLKFLIGCFIFFYPFSILYLSVLLILLRLITLNLFIVYGSSNTISFLEIIRVKINWTEIKNVVFSNWAFIIISSLSVVNVRIGNIIVSKVLSLKDVADYEVSFKLLSIAYLLPIVITSSLYPMLISAYKENIDKLKSLYQKSFLPLTIYGFLAYTFIYSYADFFIPLLFGEKFSATGNYCREMFLIMTIFPTIFLQANVLLALKLEKLDMICNICSLCFNILFCLIGLYYFKSLSVVNYAIFFSFLLFHLIQDFILVRKKVTGLRHVTLFYVLGGITVFVYYLMSLEINKIYLFIIFWLLVSTVALLYFLIKKGRIKISARVMND